MHEVKEIQRAEEKERDKPRWNAMSLSVSASKRGWGCLT